MTDDRTPTDGHGPVPVDPSTDVGSAALAAALATGDVDAIGRALRHDYVVVPLMRTEAGQTQTRVFAPDPPGAKPYELCLFSSVATFAAFIGDSGDRELALQRGPSLGPFLAHYSDVLDCVRFDPAGPHPLQASVADVLAVLVPRSGDDDVAWIAEGADAVGFDAIAPAAVAPDLLVGARTPVRAVGFDLRLPRQWFVIDLVDLRVRDKQISQLVRKQLRVLGDRGVVLRRDVEGWLRTTAVRAASSGGQLLAFLLQRNETAALALSLVLYWHELGPSLPGDSHLDRVMISLRSRMSPEDELVGADTAAGPLVRHSHIERGADEVGGGGLPMLVLDYWLERPDGGGLVLLSFSTPHLDAREAIVLLTDTLVLHGAWVVDEETPAQS
jgi:hypothetical protein